MSKVISIRMLPSRKFNTMHVNPSQITETTGVDTYAVCIPEDCICRILSLRSTEYREGMHTLNDDEMMIMWLHPWTILLSTKTREVVWTLGTIRRIN